ncbi:hypothetical protein LJR153_007366 [Paenibacillus sp. LjRoot153]
MVVSIWARVGCSINLNRKILENKSLEAALNDAFENGQVIISGETILRSETIMKNTKTTIRI